MITFLGQYPSTSGFLFRKGKDREGIQNCKQGQLGNLGGHKLSLKDEISLE